jgi:putative flippase GtrA
MSTRYDFSQDSPKTRRTDPLPEILEFIPRPLRFLGVGGIGLGVDLSVFTLLTFLLGIGPLYARLGSLAVATIVTWRLNRTVTFSKSGRRASDEVLRYGLVTAVSQGVSYATFALLVLTAFNWLPQAALILGAAVGAVFSYNGHRLFAFRPIEGAAGRSVRR